MLSLFRCEASLGFHCIEVAVDHDELQICIYASDRRERCCEGGWIELSKILIVGNMNVMDARRIKARIQRWSHCSQNYAASITLISRRMDRARRQLSNGGLGLKFGAREVTDRRLRRWPFCWHLGSVFEGVHCQIFTNRRP
jgi:hypothetical protein